MLDWLKCADGKLMEPLDIVLLALFPYWNTTDTNGNCFSPRHYEIPFLKAYASQNSTLFVPDDLIDSLNVIFRGSILVIIGYILCKHIWEYVDPNFRRIYPSHKKWYVIANMFKAFVLALLTTNSFYWKELINSQLDKFQSIQTKRPIALYMVPDIVALLMVPNLPKTTIIHHVTTSLSGCLILCTNLQVKGFTGLLGFAKMGTIYGSLSALSYSVNAYLGLRVVYRTSKWVKFLSYWSLFVYITMSVVNWIFHSIWLIGVIQARDFSFFSILYGVVFFLIVSDDIVLIKWLLRQTSPMAEDFNKKK